MKMSLQKHCRVMFTLVALASVIACGGSSGVTTSDPGPADTALAVETGSFTASAHKGDLPGELEGVLNCEHFAEASYALLEVKPFTNVLDAEKKHVTALERLYNKRGINHTAQEICGDITNMPKTCAAALALEEEIASRYLALLATALPRDVENVLTHLKEATDDHVVAFGNCVQR
jgi:hypothetical protein